MKTRTPTAEEKRFMAAMCELGCIVCLKKGFDTPQVTPHHMDGRVKPDCHKKILPLCGNHHQEPDTQKPPRWYSLHANKRDFEREYGTEQELYEECLEIMGVTV